MRSDWPAITSARNAGGDMERGAVRGSLTEVDLLVEHYLHGSNGDALLALRQALADALRDAVDARIRILELERAASAGYRRRPSDRAAAGEAARSPG
jgi:hypothetical protein